MRSIHQTVLLTLLALVLFGGAAHAQCYGYPNLIANGDFENGTGSWTKTQGSFDVKVNPNDDNDHDGYLFGSGSTTSTIQQSFTFGASGWHIVYLEMAGLGSCSVTAQVVGGVNVSGTEQVRYNVLTYTFQV